jgi:hypothetical protein
VSGRAHLKTGYLEGVRALAGYVLDHSGKRWIVVCLLNDPKAQSSANRQWTPCCFGWRSADPARPAALRPTGLCESPQSSRLLARAKASNCAAGKGLLKR